METTTNRARSAGAGARKPGRRAEPIFLSAFFLAAMLFLTEARAAEPAASRASCSKSDYARSRRRFQELYGAGRYAEAVETLQRAKESCWGVLDAKDRGWLVSDLALANLKAGHPDICLQVLDEAPKELEPQSRVAKAIEFNRGLCSASPTQDNTAPAQVSELAVQVMPGLDISSPSEATTALTREWKSAWELREGRLPRRRARELRRCTDLDGVGRNDVQYENDPDAYSFQNKALACRVLRMITTARPSRISHVRDVLTVKKPDGVLPAALAPAISDDELGDIARAQREGRSWHDYDGTLRFEAGPQEEKWRQLSVRGNDYAGFVQWWATGDFNADGFEDVIVYRSMGPTGGTAADIAVFVLTRTRPKGVLQVLERLE
ncbi:hypothetical protein [Vitiosangium sp. GDMCC 1.1324]|uniref:hypothetical protein n=1 Tax=Vitiosangium sp. (strain GDMCC 1.1324) TaxID=2138576 RepID=UPI000D3B357C|nr:hypothetical protein [Vitiosangium sp. GDMCC 1.1324]PTL76911.1 hypothetical protein DAT35_47445 [Vitiosangium sp. GDMCC 1.1324]